MRSDQHATDRDGEQDQELQRALRAAIGPPPRLDLSAYGDYDFVEL